MFAKSITGSARFLRMPVSARLLYYDLGMQADDEGVVEAFPVMRMTGASEDDLKVLAAKEFIYILNDDLVSLIKDWKVNNLIKMDRFNQSVYHELKEGFQSGTQMEPIWNPNGTQMEPQVRLGKVRLDKDSIVDVNDVPDYGSLPNDNINGYVSSYITLSDTAMHELTSFKEDGLTDDVIKWAVDYAVGNHIYKWRYVRAILKSAVERKLLTLPDLLAAEADRDKQIADQKAAKAAPQTQRQYQQHEYKDDADYGVVDMTAEERQRKADEALEQIKKEHPEWYA